MVLCPRGAGGHLAGFYQHFVCAERRFYLGLAGPKVKVPAIAGPGRAVVTIDWCIFISVSSIHVYWLASSIHQFVVVVISNFWLVVAYGLLVL